MDEGGLHDVDKLYESGLFVDNPFARIAAQAAAEVETDPWDDPHDEVQFGAKYNRLSQETDDNELDSPVQEFLETRAYRVASKTEDSGGVQAFVLS